MGLTQCTLPLMRSLRSSNVILIDLRGPGRGSVTFNNRLQVLSDVTLTDIKNFHFGDLIFFKYCMFSIVRVEVSRPISRDLDQLKIFWKIFLYLHKGGVRILNGIKHFSIDNLSI